MKIVKKIVIEKFRKMSKLEIPLDAHIVAIAGQNGTQKTSLLGMIAHPFSLKDKRDPMSKELDVYGCRFGSAIQDRFKFSSNYDKAGEHIWSIEIVPWMWSRSRVKCVSARRSDVNEGWRFSDPSKKKGAGYIQCPIIYLSLKRLIPIGELKKVKNPQLNLSLEEQRLFGRWHNEILISTEKVLGVRSVNGWAKKSAGITTGQYDALTMSAGQDNVGEIIEASGISVGRSGSLERRCFAYAKFRPNRRGYDGRAWNFRLFCATYAAARFGRSYVLFVHSNLNFA